MRVVLAEPSGACYGVERALGIAEQALAISGDFPVYTLGPLIHNPIVVNSLESRGVRVIDAPEEVDSGWLVIRSHGVPKSVMEDARARGLQVFDATCPHVSRAQQEASRLAGDGRFVIIVGEHGHPEVEAIESYSGDFHAVVKDPTEIPEIPMSMGIGVVVQTTQPKNKLDTIMEALSAEYGDIELSNTICSATRRRQQAAIDAAAEADVMIVIGGRNSANTTRLAELCRESCPRTHHIESAEEIDLTWLEDCETIAVTAGASTPQTQIHNVVNYLRRLASEIDDGDEDDRG